MSHLTDACRLGLLTVQSDATTLLAELDTLVCRTCGVLDSVKEHFLERMDGVRSQVLELMDPRESDWAHMSAQTLAARRRLERVQSMVQRLGLSAGLAGQDSWQGMAGPEAAMDTEAPGSEG